MTDNTTARLSQEAFDLMMSDIRTARDQVALMVSNLDHDPEKAAGMMVEIIAARKWAIDRRFPDMSEAQIRAEADRDLASKLSVTEITLSNANIPPLDVSFLNRYPNLGGQ